MIELVFYGSLGLFLGILAGLVPGLGTGSLMALMTIFLLSADPIHIVIFYLGVLVSAQYFGSVTAILTGVPGDPSSVPSSIYGFAEARKGNGAELLYLTAKWSLIAGVISFVIFLVIMHYGVYWTKSLSVVSQTVLLFVAMISIIAFGENRPWRNCLLVVGGIFLGAIGYSENFMSYFLVSRDNIFAAGIPWLPVMTGLLIIPNILSLSRSQPYITGLTKKKAVPFETKAWRSGVRGGLLGFLLGTVPGLSYILGSIVASRIEHSLTKDPTKVVIASESANNSGAVSMLLPLFALGIPITASESIVYMLLTTSQSAQKITSLFQIYWIELVVYFLIINFLLFVFAWKFAVPLCKLVFSRIRSLMLMSLLLAVAGTLWFGYYSLQLFPTVLALVVSTIIGISIRKMDFSPMIYMLIMYPYIELNFHKAIQLY